MFEKKKINDFTSFVNEFDRIFIGASLLKKDPASVSFINALIRFLKNKNCIVLSKKISDLSSNPLVKKLQDNNLLRVKGNNQIVSVDTTYYNAAIELSRRFNYKMLLITNNEGEGQQFVKLDYNNNHVNGLAACCFDASGFYNIVYNPPAEKIFFSIQTQTPADELRVIFYKKQDDGSQKEVYLAKDIKTQAIRKNSKSFEYSILKSDLSDAETVMFAIKVDGHIAKSNIVDFYLEYTQNWQLNIVAGQIKAIFIQTSTSTSIPSPTYDTSSVWTKSNHSLDSSVPESEKYPYYGGTTVKLLEDKKINVSNEPVENSYVKTNTGTRIKLVKKLGSGGEGVVYLTDVRGIVCKILNNKTGTNLTQNKKEKIEFMTRHPIKHPNIIWPIDAVYTESGVFVGYTMKSAKGLELKKILDQMERPNGTYSTEFGIFNLSRTQIVAMILSILDTLYYLHCRNIIIGDIKMENFMIMNKDVTNVFFVDCDSYQVGKFPATKVSPGYTPPELSGVGNVTKVYRTFENEYYALFALLFMILHKGVKPYAQIGEASGTPEEQRAKEGIFPYFLTEEKTIKHAPKGYPAPNWSHLPGYVKKAFFNMGNKSGDHFSVNKRYTTKEWWNIFNQYSKDLSNGKLSSKDKNFNVGVHGIRSTPIAYRVVDIKMSEVVTEQITDTVLSSAIKQLLLRMNQTTDSFYITKVEKSLRENVLYQDTNCRFVLKKNIGCLYNLQLSCKT